MPACDEGSKFCKVVAALVGIVDFGMNPELIGEGDAIPIL